MEEDWDNVVILDACRYDLFSEVNTPTGDLDYRISLGSATPEFLTRNFDGTVDDTVYVTANPMYRTLDWDGTFHRVVDVWDGAWDAERKTVPPGAMAEATIEAYERYPNKRLVAHFMQPHYPFIGELAEQIGEHAGYEFTYRRVTGEEAGRDNPTVWELLERGDVPKSLVWDAYRENLEVALPHVERLLETFGERSVVTSDHGNALGERPFPFAKPLYGHPAGVRHECLCKVPWLVVSGEARKNIVGEDSGHREAGQSGAVEERLADLGYVDV